MEEMLTVLNADENRVERLVLIAKALSDPIRVRLLQFLSQGRACCGLPAADGADTGDGICVCEFESGFHLAQSKVSYHLKVLKEAGLVREKTRGKWTYYSLRRETAQELVAVLSDQFQL